MRASPASTVAIMLIHERTNERTLQYLEIGCRLLHTFVRNENAFKR